MNEIKEICEKCNKDNTYNNKPMIETKMGLSKDKKWFIHKTIIVDIKPVAYMDTFINEREVVQ
jgi:hypothetical protein|tara:strand:+ start:1619 stop:1807 length:189 start_codon:yes stop_codon:yes gene_type:complete